MLWVEPSYGELADLNRYSLTDPVQREPDAVERMRSEPEPDQEVHRAELLVEHGRAEAREQQPGGRGDVENEVAPQEVCREPLGCLGKPLVRSS